MLEMCIRLERISCLKLLRQFITLSLPIRAAVHYPNSRHAPIYYRIRLLGRSISTVACIIHDVYRSTLAHYYSGSFTFVFVTSLCPTCIHPHHPRITQYMLRVADALTHLALHVAL